MSAPCLACARREGMVHRLQAELTNVARKAAQTDPPPARLLAAITRARRDRDAARATLAEHQAGCPAVTGPPALEPA